MLGTAFISKATARLEVPSELLMVQNVSLASGTRDGFRTLLLPAGLEETEREEVLQLKGWGKQRRKAGEKTSWQKTVVGEKGG